MARRPLCAHCKVAFTPNYRVAERACPWKQGASFQRFCARTPACQTASRKFTQAEYRRREPEDPGKMEGRRRKSRKVLRERQLGAPAQANEGSSGVTEQPIAAEPTTRPVLLPFDREMACPSEGVDVEFLAARIRQESARIARLLGADGRDI